MITDGLSYKILPEAKDYKRIGEGDTGPNTGGMGSVSPVPFADEAFMARVEERIITPTVNGLVAEGIDYRGFIFFGLMNVGGDPYVIEYNCRLGDPETESVIPRIKNDLLELCDAVATQQLSRETIQFDERFTATVMLVSGGYPGVYEKNKPVSGEEHVMGSFVFHAGTSVVPGKDKPVTSGGRVIAITSYGHSIQEALSASYANVDKISFEGKTCRHDIGSDLCS